MNVNPFTGIYSASKHAVEAIAETMSLELQELGVQVATVNPGPFLTGFNDRMFQTWESWEDDPFERLFDYSKLAFPRAPFDPEAVHATLTAVAAGGVGTYRNLEPKAMIEESKNLQQVPWDKKINDGLGARSASLRKSYEMKPETPASSRNCPVACSARENSRAHSRARHPRVMVRRLTVGAIMASGLIYVGRTPAGAELERRLSTTIDFGRMPREWQSNAPAPALRVPANVTPPRPCCLRFDAPIWLVMH